MLEPRGAGWRNPGSWYLLGGLSLVALSLWMPWWTAARTARIELRADQLARLLLRAAAQPIPPALADEVDHVFARFLASAIAEGLVVGDLERHEPDTEGVLLLLTNKHYALQLAVSPPEATEVVGRDTVPALEVVAWPLRANGPAHSVYFHPENAPAAYTRNLSNSTVELGNKRPQPGACHRRRTGLFDSPSSYRSANDDRWIVF